MIVRELMNILIKDAMEYRLLCNESIKQSDHMNDHDGKEIDQNDIDAILVDFLNFIGRKYNIDLGLYTYDLKE